MDLGHERRRLLVADQDVANGGPGQSIGEVDVLFTGDAEHASDTLVLEALNEEFCGTPWFVRHSTERTEMGSVAKAATKRTDQRLASVTLGLPPLRA